MSRIATRVVEGRIVPAHKVATQRRIDPDFAPWREKAVSVREDEQEPIRWGIIGWMIAIALVPVMVGVWL